MHLTSIWDVSGGLILREGGEDGAMHLLLLEEGLAERDDLESDVLPLPILAGTGSRHLKPTDILLKPPHIPANRHPRRT